MKVYSEMDEPQTTQTDGWNNLTFKDSVGPSNFEHIQYVRDFLHVYIVPVIIVIGFLGNSISFIVFVASPLKRVSTSVYLASLAFSDTGFLTCLGIGWLEALDIRLFHREGICQLTVYTSFVFSFTSIWFVNAFTMEMYIAVFHPQKGAKLCKPKNARKVVGVMSVIALCLYTYIFWIAKLVRTSFSETKACLTQPEGALILVIVDTFITLLVPFTMIIFMITCLLLHISKFYKTRSESASPSEICDNVPAEESENLATGSNSNHDDQISRQATHAQVKLTRMLVVVVLVFLVLNLPSHAIKVQFLMRSLAADHVSFTQTEGLIQDIFQLLYYANFSVNFLLYSACGKSFRHALVRVSCFNILERNLFSSFKRSQKRVIVDNDKDPLNNKDENANSGHQHSRLVDIHLAEMRYSQLASLDSQFVCKSPPCLLGLESEHDPDVQIDVAGSR